MVSAVLLLRVATGDIGVQPLDLVDETRLGQEFERPVDHGRLRAQPFFAQPVEQLIGAHRPVRLGEQFQHPHPGGRQAQPPGLRRLGERVLQCRPAFPVVVIRKREGHPGFHLL